MTLIENETFRRNAQIAEDIHLCQTCRQYESDCPLNKLSWLSVIARLSTSSSKAQDVATATTVASAEAVGKTRGECRGYAYRWQAAERELISKSVASASTPSENGVRELWSTLRLDAWQNEMESHWVEASVRFH